MREIHISHVAIMDYPLCRRASGTPQYYGIGLDKSHVYYSVVYAIPPQKFTQRLVSAYVAYVCAVDWFDLWDTHYDEWEQERACSATPM